MKKQLTPHITEKAYSFISEEKNAVSQYTFKVPRTTSAGDVKRLVESTYSVHVDDVRMINLPRKARFFRGKKGFTQAIRKAVVRLRAGERIADFAVETEQSAEASAK